MVYIRLGQIQTEDLRLFSIYRKNQLASSLRLFSSNPMLETFRR